MPLWSCWSQFQKWSQKCSLFCWKLFQVWNSWQILQQGLCFILQNPGKASTRWNYENQIWQCFFAFKDWITTYFFLFLTADSSESVKQNCAAILTKLLCSDVRKILLQSTDVVQLLVLRMLVSRQLIQACSCRGRGMRTSEKRNSDSEKWPSPRFSSLRLLSNMTYVHYVMLTWRSLEYLLVLAQFFDWVERIGNSKLGRKKCED